MNCPRCAFALVPHVTAGVEIDGCRSCGGLWLDDHELQQLGNNPPALAQAAAAFHVDTPPELVARSSMLCPRDRTPLTPYEFTSLKGVPLDLCGTCRGVWLDAGEAAAIERLLAI